MSAIARYMLAQGAEVYGYDKNKTSLTKKLEAEGMQIHYVDDPNLIPKELDVVIYTPAIPDDHQELKWLREHNFKIMKRAEMLGELSKSAKTIAVAGTHGKTSTSSTIAHVLTDAGYGVSAFIGGIMANYSSNYIEGSGEWIVVEADEFDRSFLWLQPNITVVLSMDPDHLDIYGEHNAMLDSFNEFISQTAKGGHLILKYDLKDKLSQKTLDVLGNNEVEITTFGYESESDVMICKVEVRDGKFVFALLQGDVFIRDLISVMPGRHNVENATAAMMACLFSGATFQGVTAGLKSFKGIKRRFEKIYDSSDVTYIDDYAHHPTELKAAIGAAKELYAGRKILGVFQPHLFSRTRDFAEGFAKELDELDDIVLLDIYPAREKPIGGVTSEIIYRKMKNENKLLATKESLMGILKKKEIDVIMTLGAGDIDVFVTEIKSWLSEK